MDRIHYQEMEENLAKLAEEGALKDKKIYLFGHCNATDSLLTCCSKGLCGICDFG